MEDEKYQLFLTLVERDKAIEQEKQAQKQLEQNIQTAYTTLKTMQSSIQQMEQNLIQNEIRYNKSLEDNKKGIVSFVELESARQSLFQQQQSLYEAKIDYAKYLSTFNSETAGYVNYFLGIAQNNQEEYEMGQSVVDTATWHIKNNITDYNFMFSVTIPEEYDVDSYQLYYEDIEIGEKIPISETLTHLSIAYGNTTMLTVNFYKGNQLKYTAEIQGVHYDGILNMKPASGTAQIQQKQSKQIGTWNIQQYDSIIYAFFITTQQYQYDSYDLMVDNTVVGSAKKGDMIVALHLYFQPISHLKVRLKTEGRELAILYLEQNGTLWTE
nr:TolC family protein [Clostridium sp. MD294]